MHICTSGCGKDFDCPICPHGKDSETFCNECDTPAKEPWEEEFLKLTEEQWYYNDNNWTYEDRDRLRDFIRTLREQARREGVEAAIEAMSGDFRCGCKWQICPCIQGIKHDIRSKLLK